MTKFLEAVKAVKENNSMNDAKWSDWENAQHIITTYEIKLDELFEDVGIAFLNSMIENDGENEKYFVEAMDCLVYGQPFAR